MSIQDKFDELSSLIRKGEAADSQVLMFQFIHCAHQWALSQQIDDRKAIYERAFYTLLDTICDSLVVRHWRYTCLDNIHQPLNNIRQLARTCCECRHAHELHHEASVVGKYFL